MEELLNLFGRIIKEERNAAGMTQDDLAERAGVTKDFDVSAEIFGEEPVYDIAEGFPAAHPTDKASD